MPVLPWALSRATMASRSAQAIEISEPISDLNDCRWLYSVRFLRAGSRFRLALRTLLHYVAQHRMYMYARVHDETKDSQISCVEVI